MRMRAAVSLLVLALVTAACGTWSHWAHDPGLSGFNDGENIITKDNVAQLTEHYSVAGATTAPVFAGSVGYAGAGNDLITFSAFGDTNCAGTPKVCQPLWTAPLAGGAGAPVVDGGNVFVTGSGTLYAFDANGTDGCAGTPKVCTPRWTASAGGGITVGDGRVVARLGSTTIGTFDAA